MAEKEQNLVGHLEELRKRIIIVGVAFVIFFAVGLMYAKDIYLFLMTNYQWQTASFRAK